MLGRPTKPKMRPPRRALGKDDVNTDQIWNILQGSFREIHTKNASVLSYEELYRHAYRIVLKKHGDILYRNFLQFERSWLVDVVRVSLQQVLPSSALTDNTNGVTGTSVNERRTAGERFLKGLKQDWQDYQLCINMMTDVLMYLDRVYCTENRQIPIHPACMAGFREVVLRSKTDQRTPDALLFMDVLTNVMLDQIRMERDGDIIDKQLIKACVYMLEGLYETSAEAEDQKLYNTSFEDYFLNASREFYKSEAETMLSETNAGAYCKHTTKRIKEEEDRCRSTLSESTLPKITKVVEDELIKHRLPDLIEMPSGVRNMVDGDLLEELTQLYDLSRRVDEKNTELTKAMQKLVVEKGNAINQACTTGQSEAAPADGEADEEDDKAKSKSKAPAPSRNQQTEAALKWVEEVLALKDKFDNIWAKSFGSDQLLQTRLTSSFTEFINSSSFPRASEYVSLFIDDNMKKGIKGKTEAEVDQILEKAITLLRYIQDKDLFERYYKKHLCKRLLMNKSLSNDVETQMISRMKIELGNNFTSKMEAMFKDMATSADLTSGYKEYVNQLGDKDPSRIELGIHVLTSMTWPLESMTNREDDQQENQHTKCILPAAVERVRLGFEKFYAQKHQGRMLTWHSNLGTADIKATFSKVPTKDGPKERKHELNVSTYAMVILCLFNDLPEGESLTFEEIQAKTNIPSHELIRNLQSLAVAPKTRVLLKEPMSKDVKPTDRFSFNESFQSKFVKLKIGVVAGNKVEGDKERKETEKKNNDSRGFIIEAAVVRIMKQRKELTHQQLVTETLTQLATQFKPDVGMIKKRIESLIEREYLERVEGSTPPAYRYLA